MVGILVKCPFCGRESEVMVKIDEYLAYEEGAMAQDAFPNLSAEEREMIISGICIKCQKNIFKDF